MYEQLFVGRIIMNSYSNTTICTKSSTNSSTDSCTKNGANSVNHAFSIHGEHYATMDLCSQAQISENADSILNRMDKLRAFAREKQAKRLNSQRQQISFCF
jgi:hypothetical protein